MKKILISGASGFLGSNLVNFFLNNGWDVSILSRTSSNFQRIRNLLNQIDLFNIDKVSAEQIFSQEKFHTVIHTACNYGKGKNKENLSQINSTNVQLGLELLANANFNGVKNFINTDTKLPFALSSYALSKAHFRDWLLAFGGDIKIINLKIDYMFGPGDSGDKFVPWLIRQFKNNNSRIPLTKGDQLRDFVYIDDVVAAYHSVIAASSTLPKFSEFEIGSGQSVKVKEFVIYLRKVHQIYYPNSEIQLGFGDLKLRNEEPKEIKANLDSLLETGWKPIYNFKTGIEKLYNSDLI